MKLGPTTKTAKVCDSEYAEIVRREMPKVADVSIFDSLLQDISLCALKDQINQFHPEFVSTIAEDIVSKFGQNEDFILPQGTRFFRRGKQTAVFVVESLPSVRLLTFRTANRHSSGNNMFAQGLGRSFPEGFGRWALALPYLYFVIVIVSKDGVNKRSGMGVSCRTSPLETIKDMLYCINLPNMYQIGSVPDRYMACGIIPDFQNMLMCEGYADMRRGITFSPQNDTPSKMVHETLDHFWRSRFTDELTVVYEHSCKNPKFKNLDVWAEHSREDPLFVLGEEYPPAIALDVLLDDIMKMHDSNCVEDDTTSYVTKLHNSIWAEVLADSNYKKIKVDLNEAVLQKFKLAMDKFSVGMSRNLSSISNDVVKRTVSLAIKSALREAVSGV